MSHYNLQALQAYSNSASRSRMEGRIGGLDRAAQSAGLGGGQRSGRGAGQENVESGQCPVSREWPSACCLEVEGPCQGAEPFAPFGPTNQ